MSILGFAVFRREELAGISSQSRHQKSGSINSRTSQAPDTKHPHHAKQDNRKQHSTETSHSSSSNSSGSSSRTNCAPNPKKHWEEKYKSSAPEHGSGSSSNKSPRREKHSAHKQQSSRPSTESGRHSPPHVSEETAEMPSSHGSKSGRSCHGSKGREHSMPQHTSLTSVKNQDSGKFISQFVQFILKRSLSNFSHFKRNFIIEKSTLFRASLRLFGCKF